MFSFLGTVVKTGSTLAVLAIGAIGFFTYHTKPSDASFTTHLTKNAPTGAGIISGLAVDYVVKPTICDYLFLKTATIQIGQKSETYIGIANHWFPKMPSRKSS